jgi:hypothetical protein
MESVPSSDEDVITDSPDAAVVKIVSRILEKAGLPQNFTLAAYDRFNAEAQIIDQKRFIFFSNSFLTRLNETAHNEWAGTGILAHEIAHHLLGHTVEYNISNPKLELQADNYAGFILAQMGASLEEAQSGFDLISTEIVKPNSTHPKRSERLAEVAKGWRKGRGPVVDVVPSTLITPLQQILAAARNRFESIRGNLLATSSEDYSSRIVPPAMANWTVVLRGFGDDTWIWVADSPRELNAEEVNKFYEALVSTFKSITPRNWIHEAGPLVRWYEPATGALVSLSKSDTSIRLEIKARDYAFSPDEPEYRACLRSLVQKAERGFNGISEAQLQDSIGRLIPPDARRQWVRLYRNNDDGTKYVSASWSTDHESRVLGRAHYDAIVRAFVETVGDYHEKSTTKENTRIFEKGSVRITIKLADQGEGHNWTDVTVNYFHD